MEQEGYMWASESGLWCLMLKCIHCRSIWEFRISELERNNICSLS